MLAGVSRSWLSMSNNCRTWKQTKQTQLIHFIDAIARLFGKPYSECLVNLTARASRSLLKACRQDRGTGAGQAYLT